MVAVRSFFPAPAPLAKKPRRTDFYGWACASLFHPAWERVRNRPTFSYLQTLERTQWLPAAELEQLQVRELQALLLHAQTSVPYYRELFAKIGFDARDVRRREDIREIPVLTKAIVRERYDDLIDPARRGRNVKKGTSGSTGTPLKFEISRESLIWREATRLRGYGWGGFRVGSPTFHYWAQVAAPPKGLKGLKLKLDRGLKRDVIVDSMRSDERSMMAAVDLFRRTKPTSMIVYTQSCAMWARFILDRGLRDWDDVPLLCGAEAVLPQDREVLAQAFGRGIFETYGSRETMLMASECSAHDGMHLSEEKILLELERGATGDDIVTELHNYGMPFIRYKNGDMATMHDGPPCPCGRGLRRIRHVDGRRADTLLDKDGKALPGIVFHVLLSDARKEVVSQFQAVQHRDRTVTLKVVRGQDWNQDAFDTIVKRMEDYLRGLPLKTTFVEGIPAMPNGKRKTILVET